MKTAKTIAVIDIGSNSIRTMTAERTDGSFRFSDKCVHTTRLAEGLISTGLLSASRMQQSLDVIAAFANDCATRSIPVYAYATSAVRDAANRDAFAQQIKALIGDRLSILTGEEEAHNAWLAATCGCGGMIDIGGGSTQVVTEHFCKSFPMGCVRARDLCSSDEYEIIAATLLPSLQQVIPLSGFDASVSWTGVGGTITTLCACCLELSEYDRNAVHGTILSREALLQQLHALSQLGDRRREHPLLTKRHDVILQGGAILLYELDCLHADTIRVSDTDGLEGFAMQLLSASAHGSIIL